MKSEKPKAKHRSVNTEHSISAQFISSFNLLNYQSVRMSMEVDPKPDVDPEWPGRWEGLKRMLSRKGH